MRRLATSWARLGLFALILAVAVPLAFGRAGGGGGYSGGSSSSGDSSSYSSSSSSSDGGGEIIGWLIQIYIRLVFRYPAVGVPFTLFLLYLAYLGGLFGKDKYVSHTISNASEAQADLTLAKHLAALTKRDPGFDSKKFLDRAGQGFLKIQDAWSKQDMAPARAFVSDGILERFAIQIDMQKADKLRNAMEEVSVGKSVILQVESDENFDTVHVRVDASAIDSDISLEDGRRLRGTGRSSEFSEVWSFLRRPGAKTLEKPGLIEGFCPSCGAPLEIADAAKCGSCQSWVNSGEYDWVLAEITQTCEWSVREAGRDVPGMDELSAADPALNLQFLEDRASVAFWRWQLAKRQGAPGALQSVASEAFGQAAGQEIALHKTFYKDAAVGGVIVLALETGGELDLAHVVVRWSGRAIHGDGSGQVVRQDVFTLGRKAGAATDLRSGLRSLRCPGCGAAPVSRDAAACEYCSVSFNDGSRHWVVVAMMSAQDWRRPARNGSAALPIMLDWSTTLAPADALGVMVAAMLSDGKIEPKELAYIESYAQKRGIPQEKTATLVSAGQAGQLEAPKPKNAEEAEGMLRGLIHMSLADGSVTSQEMRMLAAFAGRLSLPEGQIRDMVKEERAILYRKAKETA